MQVLFDKQKSHSLLELFGVSKSIEHHTEKQQSDLDSPQLTLVPLKMFPLYNNAKLDR
jgi:hypothetical protein